MGLPGVKVGPLDPDATEHFGQVNQSANARTLIRLHSQAHPPQLVRALSLKRDDERTKALDLDEVDAYVGGLKLENGDPVLPDGARVSGAAVRGERGRGSEQVLTFTYELKSGRHAKWFAPYDRDALPKSAELGDELAHVAEIRDRGLVSWDSSGAGNYFAERDLARLRRENAALRNQVEARGDASEVELGPEGDTRPDFAVVGDNEDLRRQNVELVRRVAELEQLVNRLVPGHSQAAADAASEEPPIEGYDDLKAADLASRLKDENTPRDDVERILEYERRHQNRTTVVAAGEAALGRE